MKKIALALAVASLIGCTKSKNNPSPVSSDVANLSVNIGSDDSMRITVHYTDKNTETYLDDLLKIYINDTFTAVTTIDPKSENTDFNFVAYLKYTGTKYKITLEREVTAGNKTLISTIEGN